MIYCRFAVETRPERTAEMHDLLVACEAPSRAIPGVVHYDVTQSLTHGNTFVVLEVFEHQEAFDAQNAQEEVHAVLRLVNGGGLVRDMEWRTWTT